MEADDIDTTTNAVADTLRSILADTSKIVESVKEFLKDERDAVDKGSPSEMQVGLRTNTRESRPEQSQGAANQPASPVMGLRGVLAKQESANEFTGRHARLLDIFATYDKLAGDAAKEGPQRDNDLLRARQKLHKSLTAYDSALKDFKFLNGAPWSTNGGAHLRLGDVIADYVDELPEVVVQSEPGPTSRSTLTALRTRRDLSLRILQMTGRQNALVSARDALRFYDGTIDELVAAYADRTLSSEVLNQVQKLLVDRLTREESNAKSWFRVWIAGAALGLLALVAAFWWTTRSDPSVWAWATVSMAGIGALVAALYTFEGTRDLSPHAHWILVSLPAVVLALALILPAGRRDVPAATTLLALVVVAVLVVMSVLIVMRGPSRTDRRSVVTSRPPTVRPGGSGTSVADEVDALRDKIAHEGSSQRIARRSWAATFIVVGGLAALLSGAAGYTANQAKPTGWVVALAAGGAGLTALMTALNPGRRWEQARTLQLACESLEREIGVLIRLDLVPGNNRDIGRAKIEEIAKMYDALLGVPERPRVWTPDSNPTGNETP